MSGTEIRKYSNDQSLLGGRWIVALLQAISSSLAIGLILPIVTMAGYVALVTGDLYRVAIVPALVFGLWNLGALVGERVTQNRLRLLPWAFIAGAVRAIAVAGLAYFAYQIEPSESSGLTAFFVCMGIFGFASGFTSAPLDTLLQKSFESSSRSQLFGRRAFWGALAAVVAGIVVRSVFLPEGPSIERAFTYLFLAAAGCLASAAFFTLLLKEPTRRQSAVRPGVSASLASPLRDRTMQRFLLFRLFLAAVAMLDAFIVTYAIRELSLDWTFLGAFIGAFCGALALSLPLARRLGSRRGGRSVLQASAWLKLIAPVLLLTIPSLRQSTEIAERVSDDRFYLWMVTVAFVALGSSFALQSVGNFQYLIEIVPQSNRSSYMTTTNIILMCATLLPLLGAWIVETWDFERLFGVTSALALVAVLMSGMLVDNRVVASRAVPAARLRRAWNR